MKIMTIFFGTAAAMMILGAMPAAADTGKPLSLEQAKTTLTSATLDCTMTGGVAFRLYFPREISDEKIEYRFRLAGETDRRPMTYRIDGGKLISARDGEERKVFDLGDGDLRIARPGEEGAVCQRLD